MKISTSLSTCPKLPAGQPAADIGSAADTVAPARPVFLEALRPQFRRPELLAGEEISLPPAAGVPYQSVRIRPFGGVQNKFLEASALTTVEARFGPLSREQFQALHAEFGGRSEVAYNPVRDYEVVDFLPPALQALVNLDLEPPQPVKLENSAQLAVLPDQEDKRVDLTANCHATAYEAIAAYQGDAQLELFNGEMIVMDDLAHSQSFESLGALPARAGDLAQFYDTGEFKRYTMLLHSAVYVGGGLYFEKPNTESEGEDSPYRLATWETLTRPVAKYTEGRFEALAFRPRQPLAAAEKTFASGAEPEFEAWALTQGGQLGRKLCQSLEQSLGGGLRGEYPTALFPLPLTRDALGRGQLAYP